MGGEEQTTVQMVVTPVPEFLPVVQNFVDRLAEQLNFGEPQRGHLKEGVGRTCAPMMDAAEGVAAEPIRLEFGGYPDRLEVIVEAAQGRGKAPDVSTSRLEELLDRVQVEETAGGGQRVTLVKYSQ